MIDRTNLRYFLAVVEIGSFTGAASQCRVSQPTISAGIAKLERTVGQPLFDRSSRRVALTNAGARLVPHARRIESEFIEAQNSVVNATSSKLVRIGVASTIPSRLLARLVAACKHDQAMRIEMVERRPSELSGLLERGRVDMVLGPLQKNDDQTIALFDEPYLLAMSSDHPLVSHRQIAVEHLADEPMLVRRQCEVLPLVSQFFTARGVRPFMAARSANDDRIAALVRAGLGLTVMPACFCEPGMEMRPLVGFSLTRTIGLTLEPGKHGRVSYSPIIERIATALRDPNGA